MKKIGHVLEYIVLRIAFVLLDRLSLRRTLRFLSGFGSFWYTIDYRRRPVAKKNLLLSGVTRDEAEADRIARDSYRHFGIVVAESLKSEFILPVPSGVEGPATSAAPNLKMCMDPETERALRDTSIGAILATGHVGSWELAAQALSLIKPLAGVTERMSNPYSDRFLKSRKSRHSFYIIPKHDRKDSTRFLDVLKNGHILGLMIDMYAVANRGIDVDFFGRPAATYTTAAILHLTTGAPLFFGYCLRTGELTHELHAKGPFKFTPTGNRKNDTRAIMQMLTGELEAAVRASPEQYLWAYRRWR